MKLFFKNETKISNKCLRTGDRNKNDFIIGSLDETVNFIKLEKNS